MEPLETTFKNMHLLDREQRIELIRQLEQLRPEFVKPFVPKWWWWKRCKVKVLLVCDGGLNFGIGGFDLSEFLTTFNELESRFWVDYQVTLAHRGTITNSPNPVVVNHISSFKFDTSVSLGDFDQVWLFGIDSFTSITPSEVSTIAAYMDGGGGLFATGDHGSLGKAMCGEIPRVKEMRYWDNTPVGSTNATNEVSMAGRRRNDTNTPRPANSFADTFDHQSDNIPQVIAARAFGAGMPHSLLSVSKFVRPSGIIDIMPDHPHEGEVAPQTSFTVNGVAIPTQIVATSFVTGGNTSGGKDATDPHCFPSICVWDGRPANAGRIVVDSTWHHFVNINLNGAGSALGGLNAADFEVIRQYYMNIATWMTRRKSFLCWRRWILFDLLKNSQLIEASLNNPVESLQKIPLADLNSIGTLAEEILASKFNPAFARAFLIDLIEDYHESFASSLNIWSPVPDKDEQHVFYENWINLNLVLHTSIGAGFIALRDDKEISSDEANEKSLENIYEVFRRGMDYGFNESLQNLDSTYTGFQKRLRKKRR